MGDGVPNAGFEVLYTSLERDGALAEIGYRLSLEPIWPSRIQHDLHKIEVRAEKTLHFADVAALQPLGVDPARYPGFEQRRSSNSGPISLSPRRRP